MCLSVSILFVFESLDLETAFLVWMYMFRISMPSLCIKIRSSSKVKEQKMVYTSVTKCMHIFTDGLPSIKRQSWCEF